jgi:hypothetical protein
VRGVRDELVCEPDPESVRASIDYLQEDALGIIEY